MRDMADRLPSTFTRGSTKMTKTAPMMAKTPIWKMRTDSFEQLVRRCSLWSLMADWAPLKNTCTCQVPGSNIPGQRAE